MRLRSLLTVFLVGIIVASGPAVVTADAQPTTVEADGQSTLSAMSSPLFQQQAEGSPDLEKHVPDATLTPGQTNEVMIQISNEGEISQGTTKSREAFTTARNVRVEADGDDTPFTVETGEQAIGSVTENRPGNATIAVSVPEDVEPGTYDLEVDVTYTYSSRLAPTVTDRKRTWTTDVELEVTDNARFSIIDATTDAQVGDKGTLEAKIENTGGETANNLSVTLQSLSAGFGFGEQAQDSAYVDTLEPGEQTTVRYDVAISPDSPRRAYTLDGTVTYRTPEGYQRADDSLTAGVTPQGEQRFSIENVESNLSVGGEGTLYGTVTNEGPKEAQNVGIRYLDQSSTLVPLVQTVSVGTLDAGESASFRLPLAVSPDGEAVSQTVNVGVQYRNAESEQRLYEDVEMPAEVGPQQRFSIDDVESELYVDEDGDLSGTVTNEGPNVARNVVVRYTDQSPNLIPIEQAVAVGTLEPGESASFRLPLEVGGEAEPVPRAINVAVQYRNADLEQRLYEDLEITAPVQPERDQFTVEMQDREIQSGAQKTVDVVVTNNLNQTVSNVEARLFADSPLDSAEDEGFVETLEPGESETLTFDLSANGGATAKTYPVSFDFRYDDERGTSQLTDTTRVAVDVVESEGGFPWVLVIGVVLLIVLAGGGYYAMREE